MAMMNLVIVVMLVQKLEELLYLTDWVAAILMEMVGVIQPTIGKHIHMVVLMPSLPKLCNGKIVMAMDLAMSH
jgi:hypothetical protein